MRNSSADPRMANVLSQYRERVEAGLLSNDPIQAEAAALLDDLARRLAEPQKNGWFSKSEPARGLYLWGGVGRVITSYSIHYTKLYDASSERNRTSTS